MEPLYWLTKKNSQWIWGAEEQAAFDTVKSLLCDDTVLAHFDPSLPIGMACDASNVGIGAVLFHRYEDGSERPIANASKTLSETQRNYSQIQKEALSIVFALRKFHHFLYGRKFILVTDHKPLLSLFGPTKATPQLAADRLARWALMLSQYEYTVEYRKTSDHGNADALSRLPRLLFRWRGKQGRYRLHLFYQDHWFAAQSRRPISASKGNSEGPGVGDGSTLYS